MSQLKKQILNEPLAVSEARYSQGSGRRGETAQVCVGSQTMKTRGQVVAGSPGGIHGEAAPRWLVCRREGRRAGWAEILAFVVLTTGSKLRGGASALTAAHNHRLVTLLET